MMAANRRPDTPPRAGSAPEEPVFAGPDPELERDPEDPEDPLLDPVGLAVPELPLAEPVVLALGEELVVAEPNNCSEEKVWQLDDLGMIGVYGGSTGPVNG